VPGGPLRGHEEERYKKPGRWNIIIQFNDTIEGISPKENSGNNVEKRIPHWQKWWGRGVHLIGGMKKSCLGTKGGTQMGGKAEG